VLGTLPGEESLRRQEYYAHPRNLFWPIVFALFDAVPTPSYPERLAFVEAHGIGLWDVCQSGQREASADSTIRAVAFNGSGARRLYDRHFARRPGLLYLALPSTSPAYASLGFAAKLAHWSALREVLGAGPSG